MERSEGFPPLARKDAQILILGSLPGRKSIDVGQYYGHPRNAFWHIAAELFAVRGNYQSRCKALLQHKVALWDVLHASVRPGSLDADIRMHTARANRFGQFFSAHPNLAIIAFNGKKAEQLFHRFVEAPHGVQYCSLPSTSPAYAALSVDKKLAIWREHLAPYIS